MKKYLKFIFISSITILICLLLFSIFWYENSTHTAIFFGDSVAYGTATDGRGFGYYLDKRFHFKRYKSAAVPTSTFNTKTQGKNNIIEQIKKNIGGKYEYVIIEGGFGDLRDIPKIGALNKKGNDNYDTTTFAGAVDYSFDLITSTWNNSKIGVIISYDVPKSKHGVRQDHTKTKEYWDVLKKACDKWQIDYIDLFEGGTYENDRYESYSDIFNVTTDKYLSKKDMIHPNDNGYKVITKYISKWMIDLNPHSCTKHKTKNCF